MESSYRQFDASPSSRWVYLWFGAALWVMTAWQIQNPWLTAISVVLLAVLALWRLLLYLTEPADVPELTNMEQVCEKIWCRGYLVNISGASCYSTMTVILLNDGSYCVHSPCPFDDVCEQFLRHRTVSHLLAPGDWHHFHIGAWAMRFPAAKVLICPGVEVKQPFLRYHGFIQDYVSTAGNALSAEFEAVFSEGFSLMHEVVMYHKPSRHLLLVDLVEHIGDDYVGSNRCLRLFWCLFGMWNRPKPAPEYQLGTANKEQVRRFMTWILESNWQIEGIILSHGNNLHHVSDKEAKDFLRTAWQGWL